MSVPTPNQSDAPSDTPLPVSGSTLSSNPRLADAVTGFNGTYGMDYFDDGAVRRMLREQRAAYRRTTHGAPMCLTSLVGTAGLVWLVWVLRGEQGESMAASVPPAVLLTLSVLAFAALYRQGVRKLRHLHLEGYRHVLAAAMAHGVQVTHVPTWLTGRGGGGLEAVPLPPYAPGGGPVVADVPRSTAAPLPAKPDAVAEYERIADRGGWHDEAGWVLIVAAGVGVVVAITRDVPAAFAALALAPAGVVAWIAGHRLGRRQRELEAEARAYVTRLAVAQTSGAVIPELSPQLTRLLESRTD